MLIIQKLLISTKGRWIVENRIDYAPVLAKKRINFIYSTDKIFLIVFL